MRIMLLLEVLRVQWGRPLSPTSFYRCQAHNLDTKGSSPYSAHMSGQAVDILLPSSDADIFISLAESIFPYVYVGKGFVHCAMFNR